jgi:hypothetical protein
MDDINEDIIDLGRDLSLISNFTRNLNQYEEVVDLFYENGKDKPV